MRNQIVDPADDTDICNEGKVSCPEGYLYKPLLGCKRDESVKITCTTWANSSKYIISGAEGTLLLESGNLTNSDYKLEGEQMFICVPTSLAQTVNKEELWPVPNFILSVVLIIMSILCLVAQLILYCVYKALRNIPGLILICLCSSLLLAQLMFLVTLFVETLPEVGYWCSALAIMKHYAFLASFFWTNVMAFDVAQMLSTMALKSQGKTKFIWYNVYAWGCPLLAVGAAIIADFCDGDIVPAYGAAGCWFGTLYGLLTYFLGPVYLIIVVNIVLYTISIISIVRAAQQTKMVNPNLKERLYLAIKLIVVMGLPWIFAAAVISENLIVKYIFVILNATQGIQIFICYVFSKTVIKLIRKGGDMSRSKSHTSTRTSNFSISNRNSSNSISSKYGRQISHPSAVDSNDKMQPIKRDNSRQQPITRDNSRQQAIAATDNQYKDDKAIPSPIAGRTSTLEEKNNNGVSTDPNFDGTSTKPQTRVGRITTV